MTHALAAPALRRRLHITALGPGLLLSIAVAALAIAGQQAEAALFGRAWLEALVLAILLGAAVRTAWTPPAAFEPGVAFSAKILLEVAVLLLGASVSAAVLLGVGLPLIAGIAALVAVAITVSYGLGRLLGLPHKLATLIACGNSICGNSAIAAVAPVIDADGDEVAAAVAFTAVLGVAVVLALPVLAVALDMTPRSFGVFAGLTVYAVPQVLAATAPISSLSAQVGTLVKLVRVLMLGPVVFTLSLITSRRDAASGKEAARRPGLHHLVPWFIVGFLALVAARSFGLIGAGLAQPMGVAANTLTIVAMAALGLGVDIRMVTRAGPRVTVVVTVSLIALGALALGLIHVLALR